MLPLNVVFIELLGAVVIFLLFVRFVFPLCNSRTEMGTAASSISWPERINGDILIVQSA